MHGNAIHRDGIDKGFYIFREKQIAHDVIPKQVCIRYTCWSSTRSVNRRIVYAVWFGVAIMSVKLVVKHEALDMCGVVEPLAAVLDNSSATVCHTAE